MCEPTKEQALAWASRLHDQSEWARLSWQADADAPALTESQRKAFVDRAIDQIRSICTGDCDQDSASS